MIRSLSAGALACAVVLGQAGQATAQRSNQPSPPPAPPAAASPAPPQQTAATYEDWIVRCETRQGPPVKKACEMVQFTQLKGQAGVLTQIGIAHPVKGQPISVVIQVPISVWLPTGVKLVTHDKDEGTLATFKWCVPAACFGTAEVKDDTIRKWRAVAPGEGPKLLFKDTSQRDVALPVSFKGFGIAYDALMKE
jgi:invasion protein IalB